MRKKIESRKLVQLAAQSIKLDQQVEWKNNIGEVFVYEDGELVAYTDTRIIEHEGNGLVNLMESPIYFEDAGLPEMPANVIE